MTFVMTCPNVCITLVVLIFMRPFPPFIPHCSGSQFFNICIYTYLLVRLFPPDPKQYFFAYDSKADQHQLQNIYSTICLYLTKMSQLFSIPSTVTPKKNFYDVSKYQNVIKRSKVLDGAKRLKLQNANYNLKMQSVTPTQFITSKHELKNIKSRV